MKTIINYSAFALFALACFGLSGTVTAAPPGNVSLGPQALQSNTTGTNDTALGFQALKSNTTGSFNTAAGAQTLLSNTTGADNTAMGFAAFGANGTGSENVAVGSHALQLNTTEDFNTAIGFLALAGGNGHANTATGFEALANIGFNVVNAGGENVANGASALFNNLSGWWNVAMGNAAGFNITGKSNIALGSFAGFSATSGDCNIYIGNEGVGGESNTIRIGHLQAPSPNSDASCTQTATYIAGIYGVTPAGLRPLPVCIDANGQLGTGCTPIIGSSSPGAPGSRSLRRQLASYEAQNTKLRDDFRKEQSTVQELKRQVAALTGMVKEQASQIQKVSAELETGNPAPQTVANNQ
jgi:hypothetical protein